MITFIGTNDEFNAAFMCYGNYGKYQKPLWKMHMNTPSWYFLLGNS